ANHHYLTRAGHCLEGVADQSVDLVLNNPPFHAGGAKTSSVALEMFAEAKRVLKTGGQIQVVGNRHLGYHKRLRNIFGNCETVATNDKFAVLRAIRQ
ncbi:MAG: class I SAM-dependent methyltransferase, partial [Gammaproteobacteria bacterium]